MATQNYAERLHEEIEQVPQQYMPALIDIVHAFRQSVEQKSLEESFALSWKQAQAGEVHPIETLWDGIEDD